MAKNTSGMKLKIIIVSLVVLIGAACVVGFISFSEFQKMKDAVEIDRIYKNVYLNDVPVGGMKKQEAIEAVSESNIRFLKDNKITIRGNDHEVSFTYADLEPKFDLSEAVEQAYHYAREGNIADRYAKITALETTPHKINAPIKFTFDDTIIINKIEELAPLVNIEPISASISTKNGKIEITEGQTGLQLNVQGTLNKVKDLIDKNESGTVEADFIESQPKFTAEQLKGKQQLLGTFKTTFAVDGAGRNDNIFNAASKINGFVLMPGEVFSTNKAFGAMTFDNGYRLAPVIESGKLVQGMGGGVCQVSSTLYNAVLFAELEVVERQNHSLKVGYLDWGLDATLAGDYIDFKFKNNTEYPVVIEAKISGNTLTASIYGDEIHNPSRRLVFQKALAETVPPGPESIVKDPALPEGTRVVETPARTGYKYNLYKIVYENDKEVEKTLANTSYYRATAAVVRVGTGLPVPVEDPTQIQPNPDVPQDPQPGNNPSDVVQDPPTQPVPPQNIEPAPEELPIVE